MIKALKEIPKRDESLCHGGISFIIIIVITNVIIQQELGEGMDNFRGKIFLKDGVYGSFWCIIMKVSEFKMEYTDIL